MRRLGIITVLLYLMVGDLVFSQDQAIMKDNDFGVALGLTEYQTIEKVLNNVKHRGIFPSFGISYESSNEILKHDVELYFIFNSLKSRFEKGNNTFAMNLALDYKYIRKVKDFNTRLCLLLGGVMGFDSNISFFENWDNSHFYWLTSYYLGIDGMLLFKKSNGTFFTFEVSAPVVALVSRPPQRFLKSEINPKFSWIINRLNDDLTFTSIHRHIDLQTDLTYNFKYSSKFKPAISWRFRYLTNSMSYSKNIKILTHTFAIMFHF